jgi:cyclopropane-fatty-acyl-phospholipid synthase
LTNVAGDLNGLIRSVLGGEIPVRLRAWDGSEAGPDGGPTVVVQDRMALRRLLWNPNELGVAAAYVLGEIDVIGDLAEGLSRSLAMVRAANAAKARFGVGDRLRAARIVARHRAFGRKPRPPQIEARIGGEPHNDDRDLAAIKHHDDLPNDFYEMILDPNMAYSCAYWKRSDDPTYGLVDAQADKLDLICRKLSLRPGMRLLDLGCGWGSLSLYAAQFFGARVTAVTLSARQHAFVEKRAADRGLSDVVAPRLMDYRDIADRPYDAVASIEMGEHVGENHYPAYAAKLHDLCKGGGRVLVQQMSRSSTAPGGGAFIETYIAPDLHMSPVGETVACLERAGLEVRDVQAMREHYTKTAFAWLDTLEKRWNDAVDLVGEPTARAWRLYLAGGALAFREGRIGVDQILSVRPDDRGDSRFALINDWESM